MQDYQLRCMHKAPIYPDITLVQKFTYASDPINIYIYIKPKRTGRRMLGSLPNEH